MSYILDALKRADAERERGAVPGLRSHHAAAPAPQGGHGPRNRVWLAAAAVVVVVLGGMAAGVWFWKMPASSVRLAAVQPAVVATPPVAAPLTPPVPMPAPAPIPAAPPAVAAPRAALPSPPAVTRAAPKPAPAAAPAAAMPPPRPQPAPVAKASAAPAAPAAQAAQAAPAAVRLLGDLPEGIRREIPALAITGSVYSENPGKRLLLVNNQVLSQGSLAAPDVKLEEIEAKSSVFSFRGTRFRVMH